ncbi:hypothetical protein GVM20_02595 [Porphyrobacter sp. SLTP]|nr:hypothetical protein [Porphyrobacter sp. SLTP]NBB24011.1 hypothetical protein [Porphyrobacter sp. SLTP]
MIRHDFAMKLSLAHRAGLVGLAIAVETALSSLILYLPIRGDEVPNSGAA